VAKWKGFAEQFDSGQEVTVGQEGAMVVLSVADEGTMVTPSQARAIAIALAITAQEAEEFDG
jgi:hypothetical protein